MEMQTFFHRLARSRRTSSPNQACVHRTSPFFSTPDDPPRASGSVPISAFAGSGGVTDVTDVPFHVLLA